MVGSSLGASRPHHPPQPPFPPFWEAVVIRLKEFTQCGELGLANFLPDPEHLISPRTKSLSYPAPVSTSKPQAISRLGPNTVRFHPGPRRQAGFLGLTSLPQAPVLTSSVPQGDKKPEPRLLSAPGPLVLARKEAAERPGLSCKGKADRGNRPRSWVPG